jgi:phosphoribosylpyrophosphate synthetase
MCRFKNSIRGKRVYILTSPNTSDEIMKLNLAIDAAKRAAAKEIINLPYYMLVKIKDQSWAIGAKLLLK